MKKKAAISAGVFFLAGVVLVFGVEGRKAEGLREFYSFMTGYYKQPEPGKLVEMLEKALQSGALDGEKTSTGDEYILAYFFARASGGDSNILEGYTRLFEGGTHRQRVFVLKILHFSGNKTTEEYFRRKLAEGRYANERAEIEWVLREAIPLEFDVVAAPVDDAGDVSLLWADYMATGDRVAVAKMIEGLGYEAPGRERAERNNASEPRVVREATTRALGMMCRMDKEVLGICKAEWEKANGRMKEGLEAVIESADGSISMRRWIESAPQLQPVTGAKGWALGCAAVLMERNHSRHDTLATKEITERAVIDERKLVDDWWGIRSKDDLYGALNRLDLGGHRSGFEGMGRLVEGLSEAEYEQLLERYKDDKEKQQEFVIAKKYYKELGAKSLLGWDYSRYICLCRWGYTAGYITEEEAWAKIMPVARKLQKAFDSWEDLGRNYIIGRQFWSYKQMQEDGYKYEDAFWRLMDMKSSPWNIYEWDMDLSEGGQE